MAYVNVKDWSVDQVVDWLKGLDNVILLYTKSFLNNGVTGNQLLNLRADDLENLGVDIIGHQEIILEAVEHLRNFHYELDKENLQMMGLRLSCAANYLFKELQYIDDTSRPVRTQTMSGVHHIISIVKSLVGWLVRSPFLNNEDYTEIQTKLLKFSFEMALSAHRDIFSEKPITTIRNICQTLIQLADSIIQDIKDPLILQPASLDLTTLRKKEQELGFFILPSNHCIHQIAEIKHGSPAHLSRKIEKGDEIVQVNYQTVVGWQRKKVMLLLQDSDTEVFLTLKKRPQHTKVYGPIYMKPYRLPSKKRATPYSRWNENLPSPRLLTINDLPQIPAPKPPKVSIIHELDEMSSDSDTDPPDSPLDETRTLYPLKSRPVLQRRNTITGATPTSADSYPGIELFIQMCRHEASIRSSSYHIQTNKFEDESTLLRDKSASCSHGLELAPRPTTVIGITHNRNVNTSLKNNSHEKSSAKKKVIFEENKKVLKDFYNSTLVGEDKQNLTADNLKLPDEKSLSISSLNSLTVMNDALNFIDEAEDLTDRSNMINEDTSENKMSDEEVSVNKKESEKNSLICSELKNVHVHNIIKKFDEKITLQENNLVINNAVRTKISGRLQSCEKMEPPPKPDLSIKSKNFKMHTSIDSNISQNGSVNVSIAENSSTQICSRDEKSFSLDEPKEIIHETEVEGDLIRYELGIPFIEESVNSPLTLLQITEQCTNSVNKIITDVPPKPPPRINVQDTYKPKYPADSPKPVIDIFKRQQIFVKDTSKEISAAQVDINKSEFVEQLQKSCCPQISESKVTSGTAKLGNDILPKPDIIQHVGELQISKKFEPKLLLTPISRTLKPELIDSEVITKSSNTMPVKSAAASKISPTNSIVRAMIYSSKGKHGKKKNTLTAKKRKVSVNDVSPGDLEGYLYQRFRHRDGQQAFWDKLWFVLIGNRLYGFSSKDALKADVLIYLTGFTVSLATEVKSRSNAFKVYHTGTVFYFSAENMEATMAWIEMITAATLHSDGAKTIDSVLFSETDDSDSEKPKTPTEKTSDGIKKFGSLKKFSSKKNSDSPHSGSTSLDRKWFFNKSTSAKYSVPVPTAQFRSYRKIHSSPVNVESVSTGNFTSHIPNFANRSDLQPFSSAQNISVPNLSIEPPRIDKIPSNNLSVAKINKINNFSHASNPSLYNVSDFSSSFFHKPHNQTRENLAGFVTLEELMNRQSEEQKLDPHLQINDGPINVDLIKPDVVYGEVPIRPKEKTATDKKKCLKTPPSFSETKKDVNGSSSFCFGKRSMKKTHPDVYEANTSTYPKSKHHNLKNNRSLPRTHKLLETYSDSHSVECSKQYSDSCMSLNKLVDRSHVSDIGLEGNYISDQFYSADKKANKHVIGGGMELSNNPEAVNTSVKLKSAIQYTPLSLPLTDDKGKLNPKLAFELNLDEKTHKGGKLKNFFQKQSDPKKEKTLLGSPKLHRAFFRKTSSSETEWNQQHSQVVTSQSFSPNTHEKDHNLSFGQVVQHADYPGLEYPPVFEPETYSLSDPQSSLTILRKQGKGN